MAAHKSRPRKPAFQKICRWLRRQALGTVDPRHPPTKADQPGQFEDLSPVEQVIGDTQAPIPTGNSVGLSRGDPSSSTGIDKPVVGIRHVDHNLKTGDRKRTLLKYETAVTELRAAIKLARPGWEEFQFPDFDNISEIGDGLDRLQNNIEKKLNAVKKPVGTSSSWNTVKNITGRLAVAMTPFAKNFLAISKEAQPVRSPS